jgi:uncharacterized protein YutE (UPF0331/DUF86 family)
MTTKGTFDYLTESSVVVEDRQMNEGNDSNVRLLHLSLYLVAISAVVVIVARLLWRSLNFDNTSLILFGIAASAVVIPYLFNVLPPLKSLEAGPVKAEFDRDIARLERNVAASEGERSKPRADRRDTSEVIGWEKYFDEYFSIVNSNISNVEKILAAAILVERMIGNVAKVLDLPQIDQRSTPRRIVDQLAEGQIIGNEEKKAFDDFWLLRGRVVHGAMGGLSDEQTARILDSIWRLVRTLA